jgi:predicted nucleic acid-binding protein
VSSTPPPRHVVCDTGPLISLEKVTGGYGLIRKLYDGLLVPPAGLRELAAGTFESEEAYLLHFGVEDLLVERRPTGTLEPETRLLDEGERQAIRLAQELALPLLIEEQAGREAARALGIPISGIAGQILRAVREGVTTPNDATAKLAQLREAGRINRQVFEAVRTAVVTSAGARERPGGRG